ncbi:kinase-like domain-containing protein [Staphylotrichum tortipilum]|uniref:non-specific serine/threonine protein kinase n=1 Tax=Staphylotrichum tortipilum TaxID=2831512 RepID=A0AAN6RVX6_9PEZI|nr:kinase-like domain-containing protein [Staphylotrichum longicolle]
MGPRAVQLSARTLRRRLPSLYQSSVILLRPLSRPQNSPQNATHCSHRFASMSSVSAPTSTSAIRQQPLPIGLQLKSSLGKCYIIDEVLSERPAAGRIWCVYRAIHEGKQFILKDIIPGDFDYVISLQKHVEHSPHVRTAVDSIPERHILVFPYFEKGLLHIDIAALSSVAKKVIIRDALAGLADLHDKHIIHTDIKPTNIMMDSFKQDNGDPGWCNVQITDLEAAVILPPKAKGLTDRLSGNHFWRSPEAWARGIQNTPSDIYSFAIVTIFAWTGRMVFFSDEANRASPEEQAELILRRHLSFFASEMEDFEGFIAYHGGDDNPFVKRLKELLCTFSEEEPRLPFGRWQQVDPQFRDLICKMTCMDPSRRITAREALQHPWFAED